MGIDLIMMILVLIIGFYMAWNIGANDVSNAMGTSVGSGALSLKKAIVVAAILEFSGAFFLGSNVSETMQKGLVDPSHFLANPSVFVIGMLSALLATSIWLQLASYFGWPVSTTHAIVGAIVGFGLIAGGTHAIKWAEVGSIAITWVISPVCSGIFSFIIFSILQRKVLYALNPTQASKKLVPILVGVVFATFTMSVLLGGVHSLKISLPPLYLILIALGVGLVSYLIAFLVIRRVHTPETGSLYSKYNVAQQLFSLNKSLKHLQRAKLVAESDTKDEVSRILESIRTLSASLTEKSGHYKRHSEYETVERLFSFLQILSACYVAFAHGANDVSNAIGPIAAALNVIKYKSFYSSANSIPSWLLAFGGIGIVIGLATWGWRVIQTIGKKITELTPTRGFSAEFGAAVTILMATKLGVPISTTHCIVGSVLGIGLAKGISALNLKTVRQIVLSWIITIPSAAITCVIIFYIITALVAL